MLVVIMTLCNVFGFPGLAIWALKSRGGRGLFILTIASMLAVIGCAFAGALGTTSTGSHSYLRAAMFLVVISVPLCSFPLATTAALIYFLRRRLRSGLLVYGLGTVGSALATVVGLVLVDVVAVNPLGGITWFRL